VTRENTRAQTFYSNYGFAVLEETAEGVYLIKDVE
jgi:hypothetical protein